MPEGRLIPDKDWEGNFTGLLVCVSCLGWNCQHARDETCDIRNCGCDQLTAPWRERRICHRNRKRIPKLLFFFLVCPIRMFF